MAKICVVTNNPAIDGIGGVFSRLLKFLRIASRLSYSCDIYFPFWGEYPKEQAMSILRTGCVDHIYPVRVPEMTPHFLRNYTFRWRCHFRHNYDGYFIVCNTLCQGLPMLKQRRPFAAWIATTHYDESSSLSKKKLRHYILYNGITNYLTRRQEILVGKKAGVILPISHHSARNFCTNLGLPPEKIKVLSIPVDVEQMHPKKEKASPCRYILCVARLDRRKDHPTLLKAFHLVTERLKDLKLHLVGTGKERLHLEKVIAGLGLKKIVAFKGRISDDELREEYQHATLFVLASRQEGFGNVFVEAMAHGLPVVATDSGGSADPVVHGETGFLVPIGDWKLLAHYMMKLLEDTDLAQELGSNGRKRAVNTYSFSVISRQIEQIFSHCFGEAFVESRMDV